MQMNHLHLAFLCAISISSLAQASMREEQGVPLDIRWMGTDLIDEYIHDVELNPPFPISTLVALTDINAPIGLDDRFEVVAENHLNELLMSHSKTHIQLAYCGACRKFIVKSTRTGTYMGRGSDQPEILKDLSGGAGAKYGMALNFEAKAKALVLSVHIFSLTESGQPIVWARTYSTTTESRLALQNDQIILKIRHVHLYKIIKYGRID